MIQYLSKIIKLNKLHVVGLVKKEHGDVYNVLTIHKKGSKISIVSATTFDSYETFAAETDAKLPVLLVLDGKGVLNKKIDFNNIEDVNWNKSIDLKTIYYTSFKSGTLNFMSFCRENAAQEIISKLKKSKFQVIDIYVGAFLAALLKNYIIKDTIYSGELALKFENGKLMSFAREVAIPLENYTIGEDSVAGDFLPLFGTLLHFFIQQKEVVKSENNSLEVDEIIYKKAFTVFGTSMLVSFLIALTVSYLLIQYYGTKNAELNLQNVYSGQTHKQMQDLETQKEKQFTILRESGFMSSKFLSFYCYELMKATPPVIGLTSLNLIPIDKEVKAEKKIHFETRSILLKGESVNEAAIHNWLEKLREMKWIKKFEITSLKKDKKNISQFEIKITLNDV